MHFQRSHKEHLQRFRRYLRLHQQHVGREFIQVRPLCLHRWNRDSGRLESRRIRQHEHLHHGGRLRDELLRDVGKHLSGERIGARGRFHRQSQHGQELLYNERMPHERYLQAVEEQSGARVDNAGKLYHHGLRHMENDGQQHFDHQLLPDPNHRTHGEQHERVQYGKQRKPLLGRSLL